MRHIEPTLGTAALILAATSGTAYAEVAVRCPNVPNRVCLHIGAGDGYTNMGDGRQLYMFGFSDLSGRTQDSAMLTGMLSAEFPAPTIRVHQGDQVFLNLTNVGMMMRPDLFDPHTVHWHGFTNAAPVFDGMPDAAPAIDMGFTYTYYYKVEDPGTYMYHCHVEAAEHMQMGMLGNLYVLPDQDGAVKEYPAGSGREYSTFTYNDGDGSTGYDVDYPVQLASMDPVFHDAEEGVQPASFAQMRDTYAMFNGRGYPDTINPDPLWNTNMMHPALSRKVNTLIKAKKGERVLLRFSSLSTTEFFTVSSPSIPMTIVGTGARVLRGMPGAQPAKDLYYRTTSITIGGGEATDVILDTAEVEAGTYFLYTTNLNYLSNDQEDYGGMMTEINVSAPGGAP